MATLKLIICFVLVHSCVQLFVSCDQQCVPLQGSLVEACTAAGYNTTYPIPGDIELTKRSKGWVRSYSNWVMRAMENCSVASMGESVICATIAPYCRPQDDTPFLPCQRVCSEYLKRCQGTLDSFWLEYTIPTCSLLPNFTADTGKCYEPPDFYQHYNYSTKGLLEGSCNPIVFPLCKGMDYNYTSMTIETQIRLYRKFYGKNFTNTSEDDNMSRDSPVQEWEWFLNNHSDCYTNMKKLVCGDFFPPCFPEEGFAYYTLCQSFCHQISLQCPAILNTNWKYYVTNCEMLAYGNTSHGYCKHTTWPPPMRYLKWFRDFGTPAPPSSQGPAVKPYVIVITVVVPVVVVALVIVSIVAWRQRRLPTICMRGQDKQELVSE